MPMTAITADVLLELARYKTSAARVKLFAAIQDIIEDRSTVLTERDQKLIIDIMRALMHRIELNLRAKLSETLAARDALPREIARAFAMDQIPVAFPMLLRSEALADPDLIEIIEQMGMEYRLAIALRPRVSPTVGDALVATDEPQVIVQALSNPGAKFSRQAIAHLVGQAEVYDIYREPLVDREDLPAALVEKLYRVVSDGLRGRILERFKIDPKMIDAAIDNAVKALTKATRRGKPKAAPASLPLDRPALDAMLADLNAGNAGKFINTVAVATGLTLRVVRRFLFDEGGEELAILCCALGFEKAVFATLFLRLRQGRLGDQQNEADELQRAITFYDNLNWNVAARVVDRWRKEAPKQRAARLVDQI